MKKIITTLFLISLISFLSFVGVRIYKAYEFKVNCTGHLKRAADSNTVELAKKELGTAIAYLELKNLTSGTVSIFLHQPKNDIGFWYENLKASKAELDAVKPETSQLEKTNLLMKLRETLLDEGESTSVTCPSGITVYPENVKYLVWGLLSTLAVMFFGILFR